MPNYSFQDNLSYVGNISPNPPNVVPFNSAPTVNDTGFPVNTIASVESTQDIYYLVTYSGGQPVWLTLASAEEGLRTITTPAGTATVASDNIAFAEGGGVTISATGDTVTFQSTGGGLAWNDVTGTSQALVAQNAYQANNAGLVTFTLPATASFGEVFLITGWGTGGWSIAQNAGQTITNNLTSTTTGVGGSLSSSGQFDTVYLYCSVDNTDFNVIAGKTGGYVIV